MQHPIKQNETRNGSPRRRRTSTSTARAPGRTLTTSPAGVRAFANASGGKLVIGIEDDGEVQGLQAQGRPRHRGLPPGPHHVLRPRPRRQGRGGQHHQLDGESDRILVLDVQASTDRVIARKRDGEGLPQAEGRERPAGPRASRPRVRQEPEALRGRAGRQVRHRRHRPRGDGPLPGRARDRRPLQQILRSRGMLVDGHLTNAGVLLFARNPHTVHPVRPRRG